MSVAPGQTWHGHGPLYAAGGEQRRAPACALQPCGHSACRARPRPRLPARGRGYRDARAAAAASKSCAHAADRAARARPRAQCECAAPAARLCMARKPILDLAKRRRLEINSRTRGGLAWHCCDHLCLAATDHADGATLQRTADNRREAVPFTSPFASAGNARSQPPRPRVNNSNLDRRKTGSEGIGKRA